ncbi:hypothetical protein H5410_046729 [Solanum commersonii]|uniref:Uncharacterized protein n=1 Tax=Solanum commersonii TaxID=4109 RepID=A0A9J5XF84_SOLCO|nr:hypothetical protein H5410_046729 [Solanum commersonii]
MRLLEHAQHPQTSYGKINIVGPSSHAPQGTFIDQTDTNTPLQKQIQEAKKIGLVYDLIKFPTLRTIPQRNGNSSDQRDTEISQGVSQPWIKTSDSNGTLYQNDRIYGAPVTSVDIRDFTECIQDIQMHELSWRRDYYTWSNKQLGTNRIYRKIYKVFRN